MKPSFQVPLKANVFLSSQTTSENHLSSSQVSLSSQIQINSQLSTPGVSVKHIKLLSFSRKRNLAQKNTKKSQWQNENTSLAFSQEGIFLQHQDDNSFGRDKSSSSLVPRKHKRKFPTIVEAKSRKRTKITKSRNYNIHNIVTKTLIAAADCVTPKRKKSIISKKRHKYSFKKTPERQQKRFKAGSPSTRVKSSVLANGTDDRNTLTPCRTPTTNTSSDSVNPTTPPSRRKLLSKLQYFSGVEVKKKGYVSPIYDYKDANAAGPISKTLNDLYSQKNSRNKRPTSSEMLFNFPLSPSKDESAVTSKRDLKQFQKKLRKRQVLTLIYKMADEIQELRRRQNELLLVPAC